MTPGSVSTRSRPGPVGRGLSALRRSLPEGGGLPEEEWSRRHRGILVLLWLHLPAIVLFGVVRGAPSDHLVLEVAPIALAAASAGYWAHRRRIRTILCSIGLVTCSAVIVHLSGGVIEAHFHFFVMVGIVVLYQDWWPFLVAIGYVVLHHGLAGTLAPHEVFNHPAAMRSPWKWAGIHGVFILGMSAAGIITWRLSESLRHAAVVSGRHLEEAQQLAHLGSWELDVQGQRVTSSAELNRMFGFSATEQRALTDFLDRIHPDDRDELLRLLATVQEELTPFGFDFRIRDEAGGVRWMNGRGEPVLDEDGVLTKLRGTTHDITERKLAEAALAREGMVRELLQTVAAAANEAMTAGDALQVAVERLCQFTGWPVGHALLAAGPGKGLVSARAWFLAGDERFSEFRQATEERVFDAGVGLPGRVLASGRPAWIADLSADPSFPRRDVAGRAGLRSGFAFPILVNREVEGVLEFFSTEHEPLDGQLLEVMSQVGKQLGLVLARTRAATALQESELRNRTIVETASDAFVGIDEAGIMVDWNASAQSLFGWSRQEVLGRELATLIVPEELREAHRQGLRRYLKTGSGNVVSNRVNFDAIRRDGTRFPVELAVWEVKSPEGRRFNAFIRDISQYKEAEEALAAARDQALELSRLKSEFLANMSHEIRTPMNGVIGLTNLMLDTRLDDTQRRYAEGIHSAGDALLSIINGILDFSKADAGKIELDEIGFDLQEAVEGATDLLAGPAAEKGLELVAHYSQSLPRVVRGDPGRLRQVLVNLLGNAVKFTETGEVVLRAQLVEDHAESITARFEVVDTGIGIEPVSQARLFHLFTQADTSTTRRYGGTGLGLALSKRLVELMGGEIGVESEPGVGSTFWFTLPLLKEPAPGRRAEPGASPSLTGVRVLVVDDNATNLLVLGEQLSNWQMQPDVVEGPREALELARQAAARGEPYQVAVVDMQMPDMSGVELASAMARDPALGDVPVILLSSAVTLTSAAAAQHGVTRSLMKPVRESELLLALHEALSPADRTAVDDGRGGTAPEPPGQTRGQVLIVEDNPINRTVAVGTLAKLGYAADVATNGEEAIDAVARHAYDAVFMDCQMPHMDGYEATRQIRKKEGPDRHVPIIAMTAAAMAGDRERCLDAGMDDYVAKPVQVSDVEAALSRWTVASSARPAPAEVTLELAGAADGDGVGNSLDLSQLEQLRALGETTGDGSLVAHLVEEFLGQVIARLPELHEAARDQDMDAVARIAHTLAGSSGVIGARRACEAAAALEAAAHSENFILVAARVHELEFALDAACRALQVEVA